MPAPLRRFSRASAMKRPANPALPGGWIQLQREGRSRRWLFVRMPGGLGLRCRGFLVDRWSIVLVDASKRSRDRQTVACPKGVDPEQSGGIVAVQVLDDLVSEGPLRSGRPPSARCSTSPSRRARGRGSPRRPWAPCRDREPCPPHESRACRRRRTFRRCPDRGERPETWRRRYHEIRPEPFWAAVPRRRPRGAGGCRRRHATPCAAGGWARRSGRLSCPRATAPRRCCIAPATDRLHPATRSRQARNPGPTRTSSTGRRRLVRHRHRPRNAGPFFGLRSPRGSRQIPWRSRKERTPPPRLVRPKRAP